MTITAIEEDGSGTLWIGTQEGLNRFRAGRVDAFKADPSDAGSLPSSHIRSLRASGSTLWVGTMNGVAVMDLDSLEMRTLDATVGMQVFDLHEDVERGRLWVATNGHGLLLLDGGGNRLEPTEPGPARVWRLLVYGEDIVCGTNSGLWIYDREGGHLKAHVVLNPGVEDPAANIVWSLCAAENRVLVGTWGRGIYAWSPAADAVRLDGSDDPIFDRLLGHPISDILWQGPDRLWIAAKDYGLVTVTPEGTTHVRKRHFGLGLVSNRVSCLEQSSDGVIWMGTAAHGLVYTHPRTRAFGLIQYGSDGAPLTENTIFDVATRESGSLWLAAGETLIRQDLVGSTQRWQAPDILGVETAIAVSVACGESDRVYVGTNDGRVLGFQEVGGELSEFGSVETGCFSVIALDWDRNGHLVALINGCRILILSPSLEVLRRIDGLAPTASVSSRSGALWVGTRSSGLFRINDQGLAVRSRNLDRLADLPIVSLALDEDRRWVLMGTAGFGVFVYQWDIDRVTHVRQGLSSLSVHGIEREGPGRYWLATDAGLERVMIGDGLVQPERVDLFGPNDGVLPGEFSAGAHGRTPDGRLIFAGTAINVFDPLEVVAERAVPRLVVDEVRVDGRIHHRGSHARITPRHQVTVDYHLTTFWNHDKVRYAYRLNQGEWQEIREPRVLLTDLKMGRHRLQLRARLDGSEQLSAPMELRMPPSRGLILGAFAVTLLVLGVMGYAVWRFRRKAQIMSTLLLRADGERQKERLEALGKVSGSIAHDFNSLLSSILGFNSLALDALEPDHVATPFLKDSRKAGERARKLVRQILTFSRDERPAQELIDVFRTVEEIAHLAEVSIPDGVRFELALAPESGAIKCSPVYLSQVINNLLDNAVEALQGREHARIKLELSRLQCADTHYCAIAVHDNGRGIDNAVADMMFDPFFTTKGTSVGAGMGLSVVHGIVSLLKGRIEVESELGQGTTIRVLIPAADEIAAQHDETVEETPHGLGQHILCVDDDRSALRFAVISLRRLGYHAVGCSEGADAIHELEMSDFDLILTDWAMDPINGLEVLRRARSLNDQQKVILSTAHVDFSSSRAQSLGFDALLLKPFEMRQLAVAIRDLLSS